MFSTMQDEQLSLATLLRYAATFQGDSTVSTWTGDGVRTMTYREVGAQAARLANALRGLGIGEGDRVGTFMWNNNEHMVAYAGVPAMGAVLHALNIRLFPEQVIYVANHAEDQVVLVDGSLVPMFAQYLPKLRTVRHVIVANGDPASLTAPDGVQVHSYTELLAGQPDTFDFPVIDERSAAGMCYTSGTTGDPKGVVYSHRSNWLHAMQVISPNGMGFTEADTILAIVPLFHANAWGIPYAALMSGTNVLMPDRFLQPGPLLEMMAATRPTFAAAVPTIWGGVLAGLEAHPQDISHLRTVVVGGSAVPPSMMHAFQDKHGVRLLHAWGMTETSPLGSVSHAPKNVAGEEEWAYRYTQGRFPAGVRARLVGDDGAVLPNDGEALGEVEVRGPWITGSYYSPDGPVVDTEKFDDGWLRTGDVGKISPNGYLTLVDRSKDVIKSGGEWISSVDLENAIMGHPAIAEAAVIGVPDEKWDERPLVAVVFKEGARVEPADLRAYLADKFAKWQLPEHWAFVEEIPKTSVGKFDKKRLRARYADGELTVVTL
ncbi:long-chain fatty acid--CoA ligase [Nocardia terpenica]|uniref:long-chain fatty acid--CoA ligase n=1 Tax=Nocardia terpenica TaxID=455432 RepID=UPI0018941BF8|nr:long-chain fatty acid--CoA ligase [Nocardia terpenica]MBF6061578.1 long-chain fatty acid--CoA ligase [Nocardia terpenica]MBF6107627.1 long-chain fatty acid--CoA ligase [Nocardia terpenica]MBF6109998.1 long-chain fatty acid--CoA ligase [Nocardia terpenica]MBF6122490.1 long-chain fatty acid--CoA ligase [Nocardia terpenica]MBF6151334.1 long-chain fatty acid--CoA ligase [Nocardia terpenica]